MAMAYVLIDTDFGSERSVLENLKKTDGVVEASILYGNYSIIARIKADTIDRLKEIISFSVRRLEKVTSTLTLMALDENR